MTNRQEIYKTIKDNLKAISKFELVDLQKGQMLDPKKSFGTIYTAALIKINTIQWEAMTNYTQEGKCTVSVTLYFKDGFANQHAGTLDENEGFYELDLIDEVVEKLENVQGENFKPLGLINEGEEQPPHFGIMAYSLEFSTMCYRELKQKYAFKKY